MPPTAWISKVGNRFNAAADHIACSKTVTGCIQAVCLYNDLASRITHVDSDWHPIVESTSFIADGSLNVIDNLKPGGRCGIVMDEGALFRTTETAFVQTKRKLLNECNLWCIVSLTAGLFIEAGAASKTNLPFFTKGQETKEVWYYDLSDLDITKKQTLTLKYFEEFFKLLPDRAPGERSWRVPAEELKAKNYNLKAINPNQK